MKSESPDLPKRRTDALLIQPLYPIWFKWIGIGLWILPYPSLEGAVRQDMAGTESKRNTKKLTGRCQSEINIIVTNRSLKETMEMTENRMQY